MEQRGENESVRHKPSSLLHAFCDSVQIDVCGVLDALVVAHEDAAVVGDGDGVDGCCAFDADEAAVVEGAAVEDVEHGESPVAVVEIQAVAVAGDACRHGVAGGVGGYVGGGHEEEPLGESAGVGDVDGEHSARLRDGGHVVGVGCDGGVDVGVVDDGGEVVDLSCRALVLHIGEVVVGDHRHVVDVGDVEDEDAVDVVAYRGVHPSLVLVGCDALAVAEGLRAVGVGELRAVGVLEAVDVQVAEA